MVLYKKSLDEHSVSSLLPQRAADSHKGHFGRVLMFCGSKGYTGAAALAAMGALRSGAGIVYLGVPESIYSIEAVKLLEPVVLPLPDHDGMFSLEASEISRTLLENKDAVLIGPGIGRSTGTLHMVKTLLVNCKKPIVLDADGINVISSHTNILRDRTGVTILTPHEGEFLRLGGVLSGDRCIDAAELACRLHSIVLLKGHRTIITDGKTCYINHTGNPGMATGGSGDVLSGMILSLLGQGLKPLEATAVAAWLHGKAGDVCAREIGQYGMLPQDILNVLPRLLP